MEVKIIIPKNRIKVVITLHIILIGNVFIYSSKNSIFAKNFDYDSNTSIHKTISNEVVLLKDNEFKEFCLKNKEKVKVLKLFIIDGDERMFNKSIINDFRYIT